jgi:hypothetical protein
MWATELSLMGLGEPLGFIEKQPLQGKDFFTTPQRRIVRNTVLADHVGNRFTCTHCLGAFAFAWVNTVCELTRIQWTEHTSGVVHHGRRLPTQRNLYQLALSL